MAELAARCASVGCPSSVPRGASRRQPISQIASLSSSAHIAQSSVLCRRQTSSSSSSSSSSGKRSSIRHVSRSRGGPVVVRAVGDHPLAPLPYTLDALEPYISRQSLEAHWGGHQRRLLHSLNRQLDADVALKRLPLDELVRVSFNRGNPTPCFNAAAEAWNHEFFFNGMQPTAEAAADTAGSSSSSSGITLPPCELLRLICRDFGSLEAFEAAFKQAAAGVFGSGYVWLAAKVETVVPQEWVADLKIPNAYRLQLAKLTVEKTVNAINPMVFNRIPLLCLDLWEHAYLPDYPDNRAAYVDSFLTHLVNWEAVQGRVERAKAVTNFWEMPTPPDAFIRPGIVGDRAIPLDALKDLISP